MAQYSFLDIFPTPQFLLLSTTGVTISDKSIYIVEFKRSGKGDRGLILSRLGSAPLPEGAVVAGVILDKDAVVRALEDLRERHKFKYIRATFPEEKAYLFTTEVDKVPGGDLHDQVAFTIEENVPVRLSESVFDYDIIRESETRAKVAVVVLPTEAVAAYVEVFERAGITPVGFDITPQAIARALTPRGDKRTFLILNIGDSKTGLYIVEDGVVQFSSTVTLGAAGEGEYKDLEGLHLEIQKIFSFWDQTIDKVILSGRGAAKSDFVEKLMSGFDIEYGLGDIWASASPIERYVPDIPFNTSLSYAAPVGTALPSKRAKMFKLLPPEEREKVEREYKLRKRTLVVGSLIIVLLVALGILAPSAIISLTRKSEVSLRTSNLLGSATVQDSENLKAWAVGVNKKLAVLAPEKDVDKPYELMLTILNQRVKGVRLTKLSFDRTAKGVALTVGGLASSRQDLLAFQKALNDLNQFSKAELPVSDFARDRDIDFSMTLAPTPNVN